MIEVTQQTLISTCWHGIRKVGLGGHRCYEYTSCIIDMRIQVSWCDYNVDIPYHMWLGSQKEGTSHADGMQGDFCRCQEIKESRNFRNPDPPRCHRSNLVDMCQ